MLTGGKNILAGWRHKGYATEQLLCRLKTMLTLKAPRQQMLTAAPARSRSLRAVSTHQRRLLRMAQSCMRLQIWKLWIMRQYWPPERALRDTK